MLRSAVQTAMLLGWLALCASAAAEENLLANPGFEETTGTQPAQWDVFVAPKEGAFGRLSDDAYDGKHSVMLHTPTPYAREPVNNWSQNILRDLGGVTLQVSGWLKVKEAEEAALWLQCWRRSPWGLTATATSAETTPVYGTADWREVVFTLDVPQATDFITLRCVLKGTGTAWFDHVALQRTEETKRQRETKQTAVEKEDTPEGAAHPEHYEAGTARVDAALPTDARDTSTRRELRQGAGPEEALPAGELAAEEMRVQLRNLKQSNVLLAEELEELQEERVVLVEELLELTMQLEALRDEVRTLGAGARETPAETGAHPYPVPPLVPHGEDWRQYR